VKDATDGNDCFGERLACECARSGSDIVRPFLSDWKLERLDSFDAFWITVDHHISGSKEQRDLRANQLINSNCRVTVVSDESTMNMFPPSRFAGGSFVGTVAHHCRGVVRRNAAARIR
jgi:hypothetical protein